MLLLLFHLKKDRFVVSSTFINEVIPYLTLQQLAKVPDYVSGYVNYRGTRLPVVDLCLLMNKSPCDQHISSRIIVIHYPVDHSTTRLIGLLAEQVVETIKMPESWRPRPADDKKPYFLDGLNGHNRYQWFEPTLLLPAAIIDLLPHDLVHNP